MSALLHMETNDVEALGSGAPDATVIQLITERAQSLRGLITELWTAHSSHLTGGLCMCGHLFIRGTHTVDKETDTRV